MLAMGGFCPPPVLLSKPCGGPERTPPTSTRRLEELTYPPEQARRTWRPAVESGRGTAHLGGMTVSITRQSQPSGQLPTIDDDAALEPALAQGVSRLRDWLVTDATRTPDAGDVLTGVAERLNALGVPVDRMFAAIEALHSEYAGIGWRWTREDGASVRFLPHGERRETVYGTSPFAHVNKTGEWLLLDLANTPDNLFGIIPDLKQEGYRHYLTVPVHFASGARNGVSFATRAPEGFSERDLAILRHIMPTFTTTTELRVVTKRLDDVLRIYVGEGPHRAILSGAILRGQVTHIRSAILFADMRGYTRLSSSLSPEEAVELLNTYFDCLVPPIEEEGGEVLKYLGDGLLAIFRDRGDDTGGAPQSALSAAVAALQRVQI